MIGRLKRQMAAMQQQMKSVAPQSAPGMLTSWTSRGVMRRPIRTRGKVVQTKTTKGSTQMRWS